MSFLSLHALTQTVIPLAGVHAPLAYLDPGTGSLIWQLALAGGLTFLYLARKYWQKVRNLLGRPALSGEQGNDSEAQ